MASKLTPILALVLLPLCIPTRAATNSHPGQVRDLNTPRTFPEVTSAEAWRARAAEIRQQVLVSSGLWPMPERTPLNAHVFGKIERDGYSIEKVYIETYPGFYLGGNLYRPLGQGKGPFPAILNPHGHWNDGRFSDTKDGSIPARCINFARQGMLAFSYDMVGFNDTRFADTPVDRPFYEVHHQVFTNRTALLWNISLMGLQTWNSIRALDFLASLPDADPKRLACTGESGGGTQTFMLGAVDDRLAAQVPVVMVSHIMQGGCLCENEPELRVDFSNMEIAAAAAPRPQFLVAATGDWTKDTPSVEGPAIKNVYRLLRAERNFDYVQFDFGHNYNQTSREAVYAWFGKWLRHAKDPDHIKETPYQKEPNEALRVFPAELPANAKTESQLFAYLKDMHRTEWSSLVPRDRLSLKNFKETTSPAWRRTLLVDWPKNRVEIQSGTPKVETAATVTPFSFRRLGEENPVEVSYWAPPGVATNRSPKIVVLSEAAPDTTLNQPAGALREHLLHSGIAVLVINRYSSEVPASEFSNFYYTYNRTEAQARVRDLLTVCSVAGTLAHQFTHPPVVILYGAGASGIWSVLAAPAADAVVADLSSLAGSPEDAWLTPELFCPGILNLGGIEGAAMLGAPHPLLLFHTGSGFDDSKIRAAYAACGSTDKLHSEAQGLSDENLIRWVSNLN